MWIICISQKHYTSYISYIGQWNKESRVYIYYKYMAKCIE